ncbi:hypothetical protein IA57_00200 [Mangrovimonas yunxiaonensis]|uniref:DUF2752 domain-containing protein n=1 Tax=Mangrovimonas yunxiaonensis TaxID=1197477 RepID=A0A084TN13_9FLAO|nr:DUF2752 domain-containing protein [Mangrovimonas yunxiaonensis]KFB02099.1 hypothetical protein IA57_00200 [Mangrovimonas yunxiaonensis]GGH47941.1 hypothetical protein GCM10011364_23150 [Mangrovimonas yunxiaonensis]
MALGAENFMLPCLNKQILGFDCMGCGIQRAFVLLANGEFLAAFKMYPAIYTLMALALFIGLNFFFNFKHSNKIINLLAILSVVTIVVSFFIKTVN